MSYYTELAKLNLSKKGSRQNDRMNTSDFGRFSVCSSDKTPAIIVDGDIAKDISNRKWCIDSSGYPVANVNKKLVRLHDYVMAKTGFEKPEGCYIDHINQDKLDNRRQNLRFVSPCESSLNIPIKADNKSGFTGVSKTPNNTYRAYITTHGKQLNLGYYKTIDEAVAARREAEDRLGFKTRPGTIKEMVDKNEKR